MLRTIGRALLAVVVLVLAGAWQALPAHAQSAKQLAPGFTTRAPDSRLVIVPVDMELFSLSAGGVPEPRADWTESAHAHFRAGLQARRAQLGSEVIELRESDLDDMHQLNALHAAVAESIFVHHMVGRPALPTKNELLDWTLGEAVDPLREKTRADYALFFWVRDSYASAERKAAMVAMAFLGVSLQGGRQVGYASLVDLKSGRVVWFNNIGRTTGDLREAQPARETVEALLSGFPAVR